MSMAQGLECVHNFEGCREAVKDVMRPKHYLAVSTEVSSGYSGTATHVPSKVCCWWTYLSL